MKKKLALLLGASGSVGSEILRVLLDHPAYERIVIFVRKPIDPSPAQPAGKLIQKVLSDMSPAPLSQAGVEVLTDLSMRYPDFEIEGFSALGVGANTAALTIEQHRAIDVRLNQAFAESLGKFPQVKSLHLLSAVGADPNAKATGSGAAGRPRYARVKGEMEEAVKDQGPPVVNIFRPAIIRGSQQTPKGIDLLAPAFDWFLPKKYHSVSIREIALAMVAASLMPNKTSAVHHFSEMKSLREGVTQRLAAAKKQ